ncbi:MAG: CaiB/BaiF CoA-transferase family protein, partial [Pseudomonadota bacterium]
IKIERPGAGDDTRGWGPPFLKNANGEDGDAAYFHAANRNKKSVAINIADPEGAEILRRLTDRAQIFVENFKVGGLKKYGLDYETLAARNPALVYCSISGFGQTGPYAHRPGYDYMIQAMGGLMSVTGQPDGAPGAEPMKVGVAVADLFAGMYASNAMLAALRHAERTGEGQRIDVSLLDCQAAMLANQAMNYLASGAAPTRLGNAHPNIAPYQVFKTKDAYCVVAVGNDGQFRAFVEALGIGELADDPRFAANASRVRHRTELNAALDPVIVALPTVDLLAALERANVPAGPINDIEAVFSDEQIAARELAINIGRGDAPAQRYVRHPVKYSGTRTVDDGAPPRLGADTDDVLKSILGMTPDAIARLGGGD